MKNKLIWIGIGLIGAGVVAFFSAYYLESLYVFSRGLSPSDSTALFLISLVAPLRFGALLVGGLGLLLTGLGVKQAREHGTAFQT